MQVTAESIKKHGFIFTDAIFGKRPYKALDVVKKSGGFDVKTHYSDVTFTICISDTVGLNWRFATQEDFKSL